MPSYLQKLRVCKHEVVTGDKRLQVVFVARSLQCHDECTSTAVLLNRLRVAVRVFCYSLLCKYRPTALQAMNYCLV